MKMVEDRCRRKALATLFPLSKTCPRFVGVFEGHVERASTIKTFTSSRTLQSQLASLSVVLSYINTRNEVASGVGTTQILAWSVPFKGPLCGPLNRWPPAQNNPPRNRRPLRYAWFWRLFTVRNLLSLTIAPICILAAILLQAIPPTYHDVRTFEQRLPQVTTFHIRMVLR